MKKVLIFIFLFLINIDTIYAKTYYSDYGEYSMYSLDEIFSSDTIYVDKLKTNRYYREIPLPGEYFMEGENPLDFPNKGDDFIVKEETNLKVKPQEKEGREITVKTLYHMNDLLPIRYIRLTNLDKYINTSVKKDGKLLSINTNQSNGVVIVDLNDYYEVSELAITLKANSVHMEILRDLNSKPFYEGDIDDCSKVIYYHKLSSKNLLYGDEYILEANKPNYNTTTVYQEKLYSYKDKYYYYYDSYLEENPSYDEDPLYPIKGEEIILYRYKERKKIEVMDDIVITDQNNIKLDDIVKSDVPYKIVSNLDTAVNGEYEASIITDFKTIKVPIIVDKKSNLVNALVKEIELNNELKETVNDLNTIVNNNYMDIKDVIKITNEEIDTLNNKLEIEKQKYNNLKSDKEDIEEVIVEKKINKQVFIPLCFIIVGIISLYFYLKMSNDKKN